MDASNHDLLQLVDLEVDAGLDDADRAALAEGLRKRPELGEERRRLLALREAMAADRVPVRPGFVAAVMAALPAAPWASSRRWWSLPAAAMVALALAGSLLVGLDAARLEGASSVFGLLAAVGDFVATAALAGAGLLSASWRGVGLALSETLGVSDRVAFGIGVVLLNLLLFALLRAARRPSKTRALERSSSDD